MGGYRPGPYGVDALLVGYHDDGGLRFAAKIRAGFTPHLRREVFGQLKGHHVRRCPFIDLPHTKASRWGGGVTAEQMADMQWVEPTLVAQVRFVEWTAEGHLRHAPCGGSPEAGGQMYRSQRCRPRDLRRANHRQGKYSMTTAMTKTT